MLLLFNNICVSYNFPKYIYIKGPFYVVIEKNSIYFCSSLFLTYNIVQNSPSMTMRGRKKKKLIPDCCTCIVNIHRRTSYLKTTFRQRFISRSHMGCKKTSEKIAHFKTFYCLLKNTTELFNSLIDEARNVFLVVEKTFFPQIKTPVVE